MSAVTATSSNLNNTYALARRMNGGIGKHIKSNTFSVALAGRFYKNNSMEAQQNRDSKLVQLRERRKKLILDVQREKEKIDELDKQLKIKEARRLHIIKVQAKLELGVLLLQSYVRRKHALRRVNLLRLEDIAIRTTASFLQRRYRGHRDRLIRDSMIKENLKNAQRRLTSSICIQSMMRNSFAKRELWHLRNKRIEERYHAATTLQTNYRRWIQHNMFQKHLSQRRFEKVQSNAAVVIQSKYRGSRVRMNLKHDKPTEETQPVRRKLRRHSIERRESVRKTFLVQAVPRNSTACWNLVQSSIRNEKDRQTISHVDSRRSTGIRRQRQVVSTLSSSQHGEKVSQNEETMIRRLTAASQLALKRHEMEKRAEAARLRVIEYRKTQKQLGNRGRNKPSTRKMLKDESNKMSNITSEYTSSRCPDDTKSTISFSSSNSTNFEEVPFLEDSSCCIPYTHAEDINKDVKIKNQPFSIDSTGLTKAVFEEEFDESEHDLD